METTIATEDNVDSEEETSALKDSYPYYGDGSGRSEPMTIRSVRMRDSTEIEPEVTSSNSVPKDSKKKGLFSQPQGTMEYSVKSTDKLASIALAHDSTTSQLMRLNHLSSSMIFPGQKLYVPDPDATEPVVLSPTNKSFPSQTENTFSTVSSRADIPTISMKPRKPPDIPVVKALPDRPKKNKLFTKAKSKDEEGRSSRERKQKYRKKLPVKKQHSTPIPGRVIRQNNHDSDTDENSKQFLKLDVKYITDGEGVVSGTMLVTPNAIMFDPNVSDPLVIERGVGSYGVITEMDIVVGASMYRDISAMSLKAQSPGSANNKCPVYIPEEKRSSSEGKETLSNGTASQNDEKEPMQDENCSDNRDSKTKDSSDKLVPTVDSVNSSGMDTNVQNTDSLNIDSDLMTRSEHPESDSGAGKESEDVCMGESSPEDKDGVPEGRTPAEQASDRGNEEDMEGGTKIGSEAREKESDMEKHSAEIEMEDGGEKQLNQSETVQSQAVEGVEEMDNRDDERIEEGDDGVEGRGPEEVEEGGGEGSMAVQESSSDSRNPLSRDEERESTVKPDIAKTKVGGGVTNDDQPEKQDSEVPEKQLNPSDDNFLPAEASQAGSDVSIKVIEESCDIPAKESQPASQDVPIATIEDEPKQAFVNFSSGLFVTDKRKCSMVQDMSECIVTEDGIFERKIHEVEEGGKELRRLSELELVKEEETWLDDEVAEEKLRRGETLASEKVTFCTSSESSQKVTFSKSSEGRERSSSVGATVKLVFMSENFDDKSIGAAKPPKPEFRPRPAQRYEDPPLYLCLKVYRPMQKTFIPPTEGGGGNNSKKKSQKSHKLPEYWFAIPREKADNLYNFFLQWSPEKYGKEVSQADLGFVPVEQTEPMTEVVENFFTEPISKDWEIVSREEANRRRMTLLECEMDLPLPELLGESKLLDTTHISKLTKELPPRTEGYNWSLIYNTASHGFSLQSLYRTMQDWESPVLLLLEDATDCLFGALVSCPLKESEAYYGTGETFLFQFQPGDDGIDLLCHRWTGENMYFIKGDKDSISIGGGEGTIGLWLDGDLYHGRCRRCKTFDNEILSGTEDFVIKNLEVWGFVM